MCLSLTVDNNCDGLAYLSNEGFDGCRYTWYIVERRGAEFGTGPKSEQQDVKLCFVKIHNGKFARCFR